MRTRDPSGERRESNRLSLGAAIISFLTSVFQTLSKCGPLFNSEQFRGPPYSCSLPGAYLRGWTNGTEPPPEDKNEIK